MAVDVIGPLYETPLIMGEVPTRLAGFHVNVTPEFMEAQPELGPFVVTPTALSRVWSGDDPLNPVLTVALRFADEAEALAYFPA